EGISATWIMLGWISGDLFTWFWVPKALRRLSAKQKNTTIPEFLAYDKSNGPSTSIRILVALLTAVFLGIYAAAQLHAGSKAIHVLFGFEEYIGILAGSLIVLLYSFSGGIRASIYTDSVQAVVMLASMLLLVTLSLTKLGGFTELFTSLAAIDPKLVRWNKEGLKFGLFLYALGWLFAGIGVTGQPHIMIRAMTIDNVKNFKTARNVYFTWYVLFTIATLIVGLSCRVLLPELYASPELALPKLSYKLLPEFATGIVLAGLVSATISTADSQILSCAAAISQDATCTKRETIGSTRLATAVAIVIETVIALSATSTVFNLVAISWSVLASALSPLMILRALEVSLPNAVSILTMVTGLSTMLIWRFIFGLQNSVFDAMPGIIMGFIPFLIYRLYRFKACAPTR
ncbi:MAG TPA: sodium/proline symporter, partial [Turneriella sp.]|nr:sodium/proline symporter [Turneriella sp.]